MMGLLALAPASGPKMSGNARDLWYSHVTADVALLIGAVCLSSNFQWTQYVIDSRSKENEHVESVEMPRSRFGLRFRSSG
jgi:hypothetical protein